jgi:serine protease Do
MVKSYGIVATISGVIVAVILLCGIVYTLFYQQSLLQQIRQEITLQEQVTKNKEEVGLVRPVAEKMVTKNELWRPIQEKARDTVVQVFSQIARVDLLQPFKTPSQHSAYGSAFFINADGDLVTNAHVVNQAKAIWIQIPSLGKHIIDVEIVGLSPERDLALLRVKPEGIALIREKLGSIPYLELGDSDTVRRADEVMALGYPLGQQSLKSTTGVISGREHNYIQMSAAINPGNSGGPLLNALGEVIGINSAAIMEAQNIGYMIPINELKHVLPDLYKIQLLRKPFLGVLFNNATESLTEFLGNPQPGGCYVIEVIKNSTLDKAGVKQGDMLYEINGYAIDAFGEMVVPWSEDKISIVDYVSRLSVGDDVKLTLYRKGTRKQVSAKFNQAELPAVRKIYPGYEAIDYEVVAGMVVMPLTINHIQVMIEGVPGLAKYVELSNQVDPVLVVTHIFPNSQVYRSRTVMVGFTLKEINGKAVRTLSDLRAALASGATSTFLTIKGADNVSRASENVFVALPLAKIVDEEPKLAQDYRYSLSSTMKQIIAAHKKPSTATAVMPQKLVA